MEGTQEESTVVDINQEENGTSVDVLVSDLITVVRDSIEKGILYVAMSSDTVEEAKSVVEKMILDDMGVKLKDIPEDYIDDVVGSVAELPAFISLLVNDFSEDKIFNLKVRFIVKGIMDSTFSDEAMESYRLIQEV